MDKPYVAKLAVCRTERLQRSGLPLPSTAEFTDRKSIHAKWQRTYFVSQFGPGGKED